MISKDDLTNEAYNKKAELIAEYKKTANIPEFDNIEDYYKWLDTPDGKKHQAKIEEIDAQVENLVHTRVRGGKRAGAGRKRKNIDTAKITKIVTISNKLKIKKVAEYFKISENDALNKIIETGTSFLIQPPLQN